MRTMHRQGCAPCCRLLLKERAVMRLCQSLMMKANSIQQGRLSVRLRWVCALYAVQCHVGGTWLQLLLAALEEQSLPRLLR